LEEYLLVRSLAIACSSERKHVSKKKRQEAAEQKVKTSPSGAKPKRQRRKKGMCLEDRPVLEPNAAGIDIGAREMFVAVPAGRDENPVRVFATFTEDLEQLVDWLAQCGVTTVALELDWRLLDSALRHSRAPWYPSLFSERAPYEECAGTAH
jgi:hypothetical protein